MSVDGMLAEVSFFVNPMDLVDKCPFLGAAAPLQYRPQITGHVLLADGLFTERILPLDFNLRLWYTFTIRTPKNGVR